MSGSISNKELAEIIDSERVIKAICDEAEIVFNRAMNPETVKNYISQHFKNLLTENFKIPEKIPKQSKNQNETESNLIMLTNSSFETNESSRLDEYLGVVRGTKKTAS